MNQLGHTDLSEEHKEVLKWALQNEDRENKRRPLEAGALMSFDLGGGVLDLIPWNKMSIDTK